MKLPKKLIITIILTSIILIIISATLFDTFDHTNYYNLFLEMTISIGAIFLLFSIQPYNKFEFYKPLSIGYFLLFISYFVDSIDQIFSHDILYTVIMEKLTLIIGAIYIFIGSRAWMQNYKTLSLTDELTQLPNRKLLNELTNDTINNAIKNSSTFCMAIIDVDFFKNLNDKYGHYCGDLVLNEFAQLLNKNKREIDILGRWGGEEFILVFSNSNIDQALELAEKIRKIVADHVFNTDGQKIKLTVSIGFSEFSNTSNNFNKLFKEADTALYKAKNSGRNKVM